MNSLLKRMRTSPDSTTINKIEKMLRDEWRYYVPFKTYHQLPFSEAFSDTLTDINKLNTKVDIRRVFSNYYDKHYEFYTKSVYHPAVIHETEEVKTSKLDLSGLSLSDKLILMDHFINHKKLTESVVSILSKIKYYSDLSDSVLISRINGLNLVSLMLIDRLGVKEYISFCEFIDKLGISYPYVKVGDNAVIEEIKTSLIDKLTNQLDGLDISKMDNIEKLLFN